MRIRGYLAGRRRTIYRETFQKCGEPPIVGDGAANCLTPKSREKTLPSTRSKQAAASVQPVVTRPTIRDVARLAGVGIGSVSRVVNQYPTVNPRIRDAVERVIAQIGYEPDTLASSMRRVNTRTVGCIIRDFNMPGFSLFLNTAESVFKKAGYTMLLANTEDRKDLEISLLRTFSQRRTDGILMTLRDEKDPDLLAAMARSKMKIVLVNRETATHERVVVDHKNGVLQATRYLLALGHRRIALITSEMSIYPGRSRVEGFVEAYRGMGLKPAADMVRLCASGSIADTGAREITALLSETHPPTAIIAGGRALLVGAMRSIRAAQLRIGPDISLIADSDSELAELATPAITAIRWNLGEMGRIAAEMLLERLQGDANGPPRSVTIGTELILRESCQPV